jgi:hypothetical protein
LDDGVLDRGDASAMLDLFLAATVGGRTFYVSVGGRDTDPGTKAKPWRTPGYGSKQLQAGDTLLIAPGTYELTVYHDDMVTPETSGTADAWITIRGEDEGAPPVLEGTGGLLAAVDVGGKAYIRLENMVLRSHIDAPYTGGMREGIDAGGSMDASVQSSYIETRGIEVYHVEEAGLNLGGNVDHMLIERVKIHNTGGPGISAPSAAGGKGWRDVVVRNCSVAYVGHFSQGLDQFSPWDRPDGIGMEASEGPVEIDGCLFEHNRGDGVDSKSRHTLVHNTTIANNYADSLKLWGDGSRAENVLIYGDGDGDPNNTPCTSIVLGFTGGTHFELVNVTVDDNTERNNWTICCDTLAAGTGSVLMRNCIVAHGSGLLFLVNSESLTADHCLFCGGGEWPDGWSIQANGHLYGHLDLPALGEGNVSGEPQFVHRAWGSEGDYHLLAGSPGVDKGTSDDAPTKDLDGVSRPQGAAFDIGAHER